MLNHGVTFNYSSAKVCSPAIYETSFSYDKGIWIAVTDFYMYIYLIVLSSLTITLQLVNFTASLILVYCLMSSSCY